jgi:hypothetical protein
MQLQQIDQIRHLQHVKSIPAGKSNAGTTLHNQDLVGVGNVEEIRQIRFHLVHDIRR